ncbi:MAG: alanine--tRNA ligase [Bacteroidales bacterium]
MTSFEIRKAFFDFFRMKEHAIIASAPMVIKNDPSLMFTNAGMNQFKDYFLGNSEPSEKRVANSQKCLRVSGKHNDLEEVGHDTYHHTMFEMLGNWSFGDYFKKEAINMAWEFLIEKMQIDKDRLYVTVFKGDESDNTEKDIEAYEFWKAHLPEKRILEGNKKDNFWEMGETGPCGPCSEIHIDIRSDEERKLTDGANLVNRDHPKVIEIWNLVFIQFNRKADGKLDSLPDKHVDTGMGFERLCMVVQGKSSNYDTDIFQRMIGRLSDFTGINYGDAEKTDIAMRVIADHLRAISFSIAEGQLPSNNKAGYVIRRILRRAVRYSYTFLKQEKPLIYRLVPELVSLMGDQYPELKSQQKIIEKVIAEEEQAFLRTLDKGIGLLESLIKEAKDKNNAVISGKDAFTLYDTYGFPLDLTRLILRENKMDLDVEEYNREMNKQKSRSREDAVKDTGDWTEIKGSGLTEFTGYDHLEEKVKIVKYRQILQKDKPLYQLVFNKTPFYAESGGQVGDTGYIDDGKNKISIINTLKENNLIVHITKQLPENPEAEFRAVVNGGTRIDTVNNHTATHLLHYALREVLGSHVEQKGSLVHPDYLRFDFSHFQKLSDEEIRKIEKIVNDQIRKNLPREEHREMSFNDAVDMGAMALFGEKYGEQVRVIRFGESVELCGGTHVESTGQIGFFKILKESAIAAGIRRIEAVTGSKAQEYIFNMVDQVEALKEIFPAAKDVVDSTKKLQEENQKLRKELESFQAEKKGSLQKNLRNQVNEINEIKFIGEKVEAESVQVLKDISFQLKNEINDLFLILGAEIKGKANLSIMISENLVKEKDLNASNIIREVAKEIQGGGGGQPFFATAGGKNPGGIDSAISKAKQIIQNI